MQYNNFICSSLLAFTELIYNHYENYSKHANYIQFEIAITLYVDEIIEETDNVKKHAIVTLMQSANFHVVMVNSFFWHCA